jgi:hypothetical protein
MTIIRRAMVTLLLPDFYQADSSLSDSSYAERFFAAQLQARDRISNAVPRQQRAASS